MTFQGKAIRTLLALLPLWAACGPPADASGEEDQGPPAAVLARLTGTQLHEALTLLEVELVTAAQGDLEGDALAAFVRAEAISDRLLETRAPFEWLRAEAYSVQARIRQIQSLADRIEALVRSGAPRDSAVADVRRLRREVLTLRQQLAQGGVPRPTPLERLLAGRDTLDLQSAEGVTGE